MIKNQSIVLLAPTEWDVHPYKYPDIMRIFVRHTNRVLWVDAPGIRAPSISLRDLRRVTGRLTRVFKGACEKEANIYVVSPFVIPFPQSSIARRINAWIQAQSIRTHCKRLNIRDWILWVCHPLQAEVTRYLTSKLLIYSCDDEWTEFEGVDRAVFRSLEKDLLSRADIVLVTSVGLANSKKQDISGELHLVPNACNYALFERMEKERFKDPPEMKGLPRPIIGYLGDIYYRMDFQLIHFLAEGHPNWSFVLVGDVKCDIKEVENCDNVFFLGKRDPAEIVRYLRCFEVGIVPHKVTPFTRKQNIIKLFEYLAGGLPIVSTDLPEVYPYRPLVKVAKSPLEFSDAIERCLEEKDPHLADERRQVAKSNTWEHRVLSISEIITHALESASLVWEARISSLLVS